MDAMARTILPVTLLSIIIYFRGFSGPTFQSHLDLGSPELPIKVSAPLASPKVPVSSDQDPPKRIYWYKANGYSSHIFSQIREKIYLHKISLH